MSDSTEGRSATEERSAELAAALAQVRNLELALRSNRRIAMAIGMLMERYSVDDERAFALLARVSHNLNRKLADIADELTTTRVLPGIPPAGGGLDAHGTARALSGR